MTSWQKTKELLEKKNLREAMRKASPPCIPYLGIFLTDLVQIDEGNRNKTPEGLINLTKRKMTYKTIKTILSFQQTKYDFKPNPEIQEYIREYPIVEDENVLYKFSIFLEPRNNASIEMPVQLKDVLSKKELMIKSKKLLHKQFGVSKRRIEKTSTPSRDRYSTYTTNLNSNIILYMRNQLDAYCNDANTQFISSLNNLKTTDPSKLAKAIEDVCLY